MGLQPAALRAVLVILVFSGLLVSAQKTSSKQPAREPLSPEVAELYQQGMDALNRRDLAAARGYFEQVLKVTPRSPEANNLLGWVLMMQGNNQSAIKHFRAAIASRPTFVPGYINLGQALERSGNLTQAEQTFREATKLAPTDADARRGLGRL